MHRVKLISYRGLLLTRDTADAVEALEKKAVEVGRWQLVIDGPMAGWADGNELSMIPAGREVWFHLTRPDILDPQVALNAAWGVAVPLGFTPWARYPLAGQPQRAENIFHFLGPWKPLLDRLLAEGRGHLAWPSACAAAQVDVGAWKGTNPDQRFAQAQLHRIGQNIGPVDGLIGQRTIAGIDSLGLDRSQFANVLEYLRTADPPKPAAVSRRNGHLALPGWPLSVSTTGGVKSVQTNQGLTLTVDGPGRLIVDIGGGSSK